MDLIVHAPNIVGPVHIDLTVLSATARKSLAKGVASREGTATASAAERKRAKYPMCAILPFVLEDHGRLGDDALGFVRKIAPRAKPERTQVLIGFYQAIGATLQRVAAVSIIAAIGFGATGRRP